MEVRNCPICELPATSARRIGELDANHAKLEGRKFVLAQCTGCDLIFLSPTPTEREVDAMYAASTQFDDVYRGERGEVALQYVTGRLRALLSRNKGDRQREFRMLEIGAGLSWMCRAAKNLNSRNITVAQDITSEAVPECSWVDHYCIGEIMRCRELEQWAPYDVVSLTHVIEHLVDPVAVLRKIRGLTVSSGIVFLTAPHRPVGWGSRTAIETWRTWSYNHVPAHVQYFSPRSLKRAARKADFEVIFSDFKHEDGQAFEAWLQPASPNGDSLIWFLTEMYSRIRQRLKASR